MTRKLSLLAIVACATLSFGTPISAHAGEVCIIVNSANPIESLTAKEVRDLFVKTVTSWSSGERIRPSDQKGNSPDRDAFLSKVLGFSSEELERHWVERQYASAENPPTKFDDDESVIKFVTAFKGGLGFVSKSSLLAYTGKGVKPVLTIKY